MHADLQRRKDLEDELILQGEDVLQLRSYESAHTWWPDDDPSMSWTLCERRPVMLR